MQSGGSLFFLIPCKMYQDLKLLNVNSHFGKKMDCFFVPVRYLKHDHKFFRKMLQYFVIQNVDVSFDEFSSPLSSEDLWKRFNWINNDFLSFDKL